MIRPWYAMRVLEVLSATARPVVLKPVITPSTKKAHTTSPPIRAFHPATALSFFRLTTAPHHHRPEATTSVAAELTSPVASQNLLHQSPTNFTSGSSQTPLCSLTLFRAISISSRTSAA